MRGDPCILVGTHGFYASPRTQPKGSDWDLSDNLPSMTYLSIFSAITGMTQTDVQGFQLLCILAHGIFDDAANKNVNFIIFRGNCVKYCMEKYGSTGHKKPTTSSSVPAKVANI